MTARQIRASENGSEGAAYQEKVQPKVQTTSLFDEGPDDAEVLWEQLGEPSLQTTRLTLRDCQSRRSLEKSKDALLQMIMNIRMLSDR